MLKYIAVVLVAIALALFAAVALAASPGMFHEGKGFAVTLEDGPCFLEEEQVAMMVLVTGEKPRGAHLTVAGELIAACWAELDETNIFLADEVGRMGFIAKSEFKRPGI